MAVKKKSAKKKSSKKEVKRVESSGGVFLDQGELRRIESAHHELKQLQSRKIYLEQYSANLSLQIDNYEMKINNLRQHLVDNKAKTAGTEKAEIHAADKLKAVVSEIKEKYGLKLADELHYDAASGEVKNVK